MTDHRGDYVIRQRPKSGTLVGKWHLCDSNVNDAAITYCGNTMQPVNAKGQPLVYGAEPSDPGDECALCAAVA